MKIERKFYVGSAAMLVSNWAKPTLEEAIEHAKRKCESSEQPQIVVQIVAYIKPFKNPPIVEEVE